MKNLLSDEKYNFISEKDKQFIVAFDDAITKAGYESNGIQPYVVFGKYKIEYFRAGLKTQKYLARIYIRDEEIVLRMYFSNIDKHREYIEKSPDFIKSPFINDYMRCNEGKRCGGIGDKNGICRYRKTYTIDNTVYNKCAEQSFMFFQPDISHAEKYIELLTTFYPDRKRPK